jgi:hypothetical protein
MGACFGESAEEFQCSIHKQLPTSTYVTQSGSLEAESQKEVVYADILEVRLANSACVRGCFALWKRARHRLALTLESGLFVSLLVTTV